MSSQRFIGIAIALLSGSVSPMLYAAPAVLGNSLSSIISDNAMSNVRGATMANLAAGNDNLQANVASIIMSPNGQGVNAPDAVVQKNQVKSGSPSVASQSTQITGNAFNNATGILAINQAAGSANRESNQLGIVLGAAQPVTNAVLATSLPSVSGSTLNKTTKEEVTSVAVAATAFKGAGGIAQVNQVSGSGNASANSFALGVAPGALQ
ncbi:hypothetical protein ACSSZE_04795 [Acidithiobacillus caldus]